MCVCFFFLNTCYCIMTLLDGFQSVVVLCYEGISMCWLNLSRYKKYFRVLLMSNGVCMSVRVCGGTFHVKGSIPSGVGAGPTF